MNQINIMGNVGNDPEIKSFEGGNTVANLNVAVSEKFKNKAGETVESTEWFRIVAWNRLAEFIQKHTKKGNKIFVTGKIKSRKYEKDGIERTITELHAERIEQLTWNDGPKNAPEHPEPVAAQPGDDLPF